jgi:hypothetical protein
MPTTIDEVQAVSSSNGEGWGFNLKNKAGRRWVTLIFHTREDAVHAREQIEPAIMKLVDIAISV